MKEHQLNQWSRNLSDIMAAQLAELDLNHKELAKMAGINAGYLKKLEDINIVIEPKLSTLKKISAALDIPFSELVERMISEE